MRFQFLKGYRQVVEDGSSDDGADEKGLLTDASRSRWKKDKRGLVSWSQYSLLIVNLILLSINLAGWSVNFRRNWPAVSETTFVIPPLRNVVQYDVVKSNLALGADSVNNDYAGDSAKVDVSWEEISSDGGLGWVMVEKKDLNEINQTSVPLTDGSGYLAGIEVFHELHCLNYLRHRILQHSTPISYDPLPDYHLAHCLNILRLSLQCHADLSLMPLGWIEDWPLPWPNFQTTRQCRNWDNILEWVQQNSIDIKYHVEHPRYGLLTSEIKPDFENFPEISTLQYIPEEEWPGVKPSS